MSNTPTSSEALATYRTVPGKHRPASTFLVSLLIITGLLGFILAAASVVGLMAEPTLIATTQVPTKVVPSIMLVLGSLLFLYAAWYLRRLWVEAHRHFVLTVGPDSVTVHINEPNGKRLVTGMAYREMEFVEYFSVRDRESVVFHSLDGRIVEVPVWAMDAPGRSILDVLQERNVRILQV